jgi:hypothetical protein
MLKLSIAFAVAFLAVVVTCGYMGTGTEGRIWCEPLKHFLEAIFRQPVWLDAGMRDIKGDSLNVATIVAIGVAGYNSIVGPFCLYVAIRPIGGTWKDIWPIYAWPVLTSFVAVFTGMFVGHQLPKSLLGNWEKLFVVPTVSFLVYAPLVRLTAKDAWGDMLGRFYSLFKKANA